MCPDRYSPADTLITDYCDNDAKWGPLLFLRPARSQRWNSLRCIALAMFPGVTLGLLGSILFRALAHRLGRPALPIYVFPFLLTAFYFFLCRMLLAPSWNRRAALLTNGRA
jgi:hypothetical protein